MWRVSSALRAGTIAAVVLAVLTLSTIVGAGERQVRAVVSCKSGLRLAPSEVALRPEASSGSTFEIDERVRHQTIAGFGASFLESGLICLNSLPADGQEQVLRALFDPEQGAGFSAMKTPLAGTDFMAAGPWYSYDDMPGDVAMEHFSIARDLGPNGLVTFIKRARRFGSFILQAPMDYPPDWMLTSLEDRKHQDVQDRYLHALALYYVRYLQEYRKPGITIEYLSLFNEPGIYTKIPYTKIRDLIKHHIGPLVQDGGLVTRLMLSEAPTRSAAFAGYPIVLDDPEARKYIAAAPYHGYGFRDYELIVKLHQKYPDVPLWMTEVCHAYEAGTPATMTLPRTDFEDGDLWGDQIFSDIESHASAWIYWNMILDQHGGPWLVSPVHGNPDPNVQHPLVIIDRDSKRATYTGAYYYLAHFSKYVRPGSVRVGTIGRKSGVRCLAFRTPETGLVVQLLIRRTTCATVNLTARDSSVDLFLEPISITTVLWPPRS
jgi:glucosylceramidase